MGRNLSEGNKPEGDKATARTTTTMPGLLAQHHSSSQPLPLLLLLLLLNSRLITKTRTFNDNSHSFKRRKQRITNDGHNRLVSIGSSCGSLYCSCCSALCSEYCRSTTSPWTFRLRFFQRVPFRWVFLESMLEFGVF